MSLRPPKVQRALGHITSWLAEVLSLATPCSELRDAGSEKIFAGRYGDELLRQRDLTVGLTIDLEVVVAMAVMHSLDRVLPVGRLYRRWVVNVRRRMVAAWEIWTVDRCFLVKGKL